MDADHFDQITKRITGDASRRRLLQRLAALPLGAALVALLGDETEAGRRQRRKARQRRRGNRRQRIRKRKDKGKGKGKGGDRPRGIVPTCEEVLTHAGCTVDAATKHWTCPTQAPLINARLAGCDLTGAHLVQAFLNGADLTGAKLQEANLGGAVLQGAILRDTQLFRANLHGADLLAADLTGADLKRAFLTGIVTNLNLANFTNADLGIVDFRDNESFRGNDFTGADLTFALFNRAELREAIIWSNTTCPDELNTDDLPQHTCCGHWWPTGGDVVVHGCPG